MPQDPSQWLRGHMREHLARPADAPAKVVTFDRPAPGAPRTRGTAALELVQRAAEAIDETAARLAEAVEALKRAETRVAAAEAATLAAETRAQAGEMRALEAETALRNIEHAIRTKLLREAGAMPSVGVAA
jgi:hypothetical protein